MPSVWDDLTDLHRGKNAGKAHPEQTAALGMWSRVLTNQRCAHRRSLWSRGPAHFRWFTERGDGGERVEREERGVGFRGLGLTQFTPVISPQEAPVSLQALERGDRHALRSPSQESHLQGCIPQAGVTPHCSFSLLAAFCSLFHLSPLSCPSPSLSLLSL